MSLVEMLRRRLIEWYPGVKLFGIPVTEGYADTLSGRAIANEVADMIVRALSKPGIEAEAIRGAAPSSRSLAVAALAHSGADRILWVTMHDWLFHYCANIPYGRTSHLKYDVHLTLSTERVRRWARRVK